MTLLRETLAGERLYQEADTMTTDQNWITAARELLADLVHPEQYGHAVPKDARQRARDLLQEVALPAMGRGPLTDDQIDGLVPMPEPRGYLLHWPDAAGGRRVVFDVEKIAGTAIGCPVSSVFTAEQLTAHTRAAVRAALEVQRQEVERLRADAEALRVALRFYATGEHFHIDPDEDWDSVSGEPENWLCSDRENSTTMLENGTVARMVLQGKAIDWTADGEDCTPSIVPNEAPVVAAMAADKAQGEQK